jgi:hypothetical protein
MLNTDPTEVNEPVDGDIKKLLELNVNSESAVINNPRDEWDEWHPDASI